LEKMMKVVLILAVVSIASAATLHPLSSIGAFFRQHSSDIRLSG